MSDGSLLPFNATSQEKSIEAAATPRISAIPVPVRDVWNPQTCPVALLPWLAWALSVTEWDSSWPEQTKRAVIATSIAVNRIKGTVASVEQALAAAGYPDAVISEGAGKLAFNGQQTYGGAYFYGDPLKWAWYRVTLSSPITNAQAAQVKRILASVAPKRCVLEALEFQKVAASYDGSISFNGQYNFGVVN